MAKGFEFILKESLFDINVNLPYRLIQTNENIFASIHNTVSDRIRYKNNVSIIKSKSLKFCFAKILWHLDFVVSIFSVLVCFRLLNVATLNWNVMVLMSLYKWYIFNGIFLYVDQFICFMWLVAMVWTCVFPFLNISYFNNLHFVIIIVYFKYWWMLCFIAVLW